MTSRCPHRSADPAAAPCLSRNPAAIRGMFDAISGRYDLLNTVLTCGLDRRWRKQGVAMFSPKVKRVLDVAAGTGPLSLTWLAARRDVEVLATDFSPEMSAIGAAKLAGKPGYLGFAFADAMNLPLPDAAFDGVMCGYGSRNFVDLDRGLAEMARVLRPGGELLALEFFSPKVRGHNTQFRPNSVLCPRTPPLMGRLIRFYLRRILPKLGGLISGKPGAYAYLPLSVDDFVTHEQFAAKLTRLGFVDVRIQQQSFGIASAIHARLK